MKKNLIIALSAFFTTWGSFAQENSEKHIVAKGETVTQIAKKYQTTSNAIFLLNPEAVNGISENQVLLIPSSGNTMLQHEVLAKETLYGISKKYNIAIEQLYNLNPGLRENGLQIGQLLNLSKKTETPKKTPAATNISTDSFRLIDVKPGETIYGIAVKNQVTVSEIYELNPELASGGIKENQKIKIPVSGNLMTEPSKTNDKKQTSKAANAKTIIVEPKETVYNISKKYGISQEQLLQWNPELKDGLRIGMELIVGKPTIKKFDLVKDEPVITGKTDNIKIAGFRNDKDIKELVLLLPFNLDKNNPDNKTEINKILNNDVFLNMTLDFYSGALIAIDSARAMNLPLEVKIFDSKESNRSMNVGQLKQQFDFSNTDVVIGPFFQANVDAISEEFKDTPTLIVSPLSTDKGKPYPNQVHTMPNTDIVRNEMMEYLRAQNGNIIAVLNPKAASSRNFFESNFKEVKLLDAAANGAVTKSQIEGMLDKTGVNYVILESTALQTAIDLVNALNSLKNTYSIRLAVLEKHDVLDSTEINIQTLADLQMLFPSVTRENDNAKSDRFAAAYEQANGSTPNRFVTRGFDVTFDVIKRMFQSEDANIFDYGTEQVENKFTYVNENGGIYNNAVYIMYYDKNLTIKEAK